MHTTKNSLSTLDEKVKHVSVQKRAQDTKLEIIQGDELFNIEDQLCIGIFGNQGDGKSRMALSLLTARVELFPQDDEYILDFFAHEPKLAQWLVTQDIEVRRSYVRSATRMVFIDFDNRGLTKLVKSFQVNPLVAKECLIYMPVRSWVQGVKAKEQGIEILSKHEREGIKVGNQTFPAGRKGLWFVVDNSVIAWGKAQSDYVEQITGYTSTSLMSEVRMDHADMPTETKKQRSEKARQIALQASDIKDWSVISPSFNDEWLVAMKDTGYNLLVLSPPKEREGIADVGGRATVVEILTMGGSKLIPHIVDFIIRVYRDETGLNFFADIQKVRSFERYIVEENVIGNPDWFKLETAIRMMEKEHLRRKALEYESRTYLDELPAPDFSSGAIPPKMTMADVSLEVATTVDNTTYKLVEPVPLTMDENLSINLDINLDIEILDLPIDVEPMEEDEPAVVDWTCSFCGFTANPLSKQNCDSCNGPLTANGELFLVKKGAKKGKFHVVEGCRYIKDPEDKWIVSDPGDSFEPCSRCFVSKEDAEDKVHSIPNTSMPTW